MVACELTWNINFNEKNLCSNAQVRGDCDHTNKLILTFKMKTRAIPVNDVLFGRSRPTKVRGRWLGNCKEAGQATDIRGKKLKTTMLSNFLESEVFHFMSRKRSFAKSLKHCSKSLLLLHIFHISYCFTLTSGQSPKGQTCWSLTANQIHCWNIPVSLIKRQEDLQFNDIKPRINLLIDLEKKSLIIFNIRVSVDETTSVKLWQRGDSRDTQLFNSAWTHLGYRNQEKSKMKENTFQFVNPTGNKVGNTPFLGDFVCPPPLPVVNE